MENPGIVVGVLFYRASRLVEFEVIEFGHFIDCFASIQQRRFYGCLKEGRDFYHTILGNTKPHLLGNCC